MPTWIILQLPQIFKFLKQKLYEVFTHSPWKGGNQSVDLKGNIINRNPKHLHLVANSKILTFKILFLTFRQMNSISLAARVSLSLLLDMKYYSWVIYSTFLNITLKVQFCLLRYDSDYIFVKIIWPKFQRELNAFS